MSGTPSADGAEGVLRPVAALLAGVLLLAAGTGPLTTLLSLRLETLEVAPVAIGTVMAAYFAGLTLGSLLAYRIVLRVGHIRAFAAFVSAMSAVALAYPLAAHPVPWAVLRLAEGFCMAGVFICLESWLNARAVPATRGKILASYMICLYLGQSAGQLLVGLDEGPGQPRVFILISILLSLAALPVALTRMSPPALPEVVSLSATRLYQASPVGIVGAAASGVVLGSVYALGPVVARELGHFGAAGAASFMSLLIAGGVLLQWPFGRLSDSFDRRRVMVGTLLALAATAAAVPFAARWGEAALLGAAALFGGFAFAIYPLAVAHTNDRLAQDERLGASGGLILAYSAGATAGPLLGSAAVSAFGGEGLFVFLFGVAASCAGFSLWRMRARGPVPAAQKGLFQPMPHTTPAAAPLDPRMHPAGAGDAAFP